MTRTQFSARYGSTSKTTCLPRRSVKSITCFRKAWMQTRSRSGLAIATLLLGLVPGSFVLAQPGQTQSPAGDLRILSVRKMTDAEFRRRVHDAIGAVYTVRLRYESPAERGAYIYAPNGSVPIGYSLERRGAATHWLVGVGGGDSSRSPGFDHLEEMSGHGWLFLPAQSAIEWEIEVYPTSVTCEDGKSVFVKSRGNSTPIEVVSSWFSTNETNHNTNPNP
jgi:hypothetical protein